MPCLGFTDLDLKINSLFDFRISDTSSSSSVESDTPESDTLSTGKVRSDSLLLYAHTLVMLGCAENR